MTLAILNLTLLVTIFFLWASVHVIHQVAYVTDAYRMKDPRGWDWTGRMIDYGLLATAMYPIATEKFIRGRVPDRRPHAAVPRVPQAALGRLAGVGALHRLPLAFVVEDRCAECARGGCTSPRRS